ncbi:tetratricopeptide repeat protein [Ruegeria sp. HKCCD8929]|uniref:tetratricopeptide repeat protein n=1 Tax=Ruegeria sp. HKCCD8929 TaxID=2683006 RepID=UPI001C2C3408|nr:tetratricopeptide repeat protein [Ruegeria sp. HKCCD8929]
MLHFYFRVFVSVVALWAGGAQAQNWQYDERGSGSGIAWFASDGRGVTIALDPESGSWLFSTNVQEPTDGAPINITFERRGKLVALSHAWGGYYVESLVDVPGQMVLFTVDDEFLELLMSSSNMFVELGQESYKYPLIGSRAAVSRLIAETQVLRAAIEDDGGHATAQAISDCDQQAGHPWDNLSEGGGRGWSEITPGVAIDSCRYAVEVSEGQERVRMLYQLGRALDKKGESEALAVLREAGDTYDYPMALNQLGLFYREGQYTAPNLPLAEGFFRRAAEKRNVPGQFNLGALLLSGSPTPELKSKGHSMLSLAAAAEYPDAMALYGYELAGGTVADGDPLQGVNYLQRASGAGVHVASLLLAEMFHVGIVVDASPEEHQKYANLAEEQREATFADIYHK